jgi:hypothetical protein
MADPNIVNVTSIIGTTWVQAVGTSATAIVTGVTDKVIKLDALYVGNIDTSASYKITVELYRGGTSYYILYQCPVPAGAGLDVLSKSIYIQEADSLRLTADSATPSPRLHAVASGEVIN